MEKSKSYAIKLVLVAGFLLLSSAAFGQTQLTVFYYGSTDCPPCNRPEVIQSINTIKTEFDSVHTDFNTKLVMVAIDETVEEGLKYITKYEYWDEVALGSRYNNELAMAHLNKMKIPGVPHILVYKETFEKAGYGVETIQSRELIQQVLGGDEIVAWVNSGMKLD